MDVREARLTLDRAGVSRRDVLLPDDTANARPRQGAVVVRPGPTGYEVVAQDSGLEELLARASTEDEALEFVVDRVSRALPPQRPWESSRLTSARSTMARVTQQIRETLAGRPGAVVETDLWDGAVVDRVGSLDGFLLWPEGARFAERSQPPDALDEGFENLGLHVFGVAAPLRVLARVTRPWFGQPGGAVVFKLAEPGTTVRDLVMTGVLVRLGLRED